MNSEAMCVPCVIKQCERLAQAVIPADDLQAGRIIAEIRHYALDIASQLSLDDPPSKYTSRVLDKMYRLLKTDDPYQTIKHEQNEIGKKIYRHFTKETARLADPIHTAIKYAASGNIIDIGPSEIYSTHNPNVSYLDEINRTIETPLKIDDYKKFQEKFRSTKSILYILDNAGEIYLDKLLAERLKGPQLTFVVKARPILNDAMIGDAHKAGLNLLGNIITVSLPDHYRYLGVDFAYTTSEFARVFESADIVIAKGHANFESLLDVERDCFFILMAKCPVVARKLGVEIKDKVFYYSPNKGD